MKRDMELIRKIIAESESDDDTKTRMLSIDGYDDNVVARHVESLIKAGYVVGNVHHGSMGTELAAFVSDLTAEGQDFAAALQNEGIWSRLNESLSPIELATVPLTMIKEICMGLLKTHLMQKTGLSAH